MDELKIKKTEWDLSPLFDGPEDPEITEKRKEWEEKTDKFVSKWKDRDDYLKDPAVLKEAMDEYEKWARLYGAEADEAYYFWLRSQQDKNDPNIKAKFNKVEELSIKIGNKVAFFMLKLAKIPEKEQKKFLDHEGLKEYKHLLENIFQNAKYVLSEPEEKILNLKSTSSYSLWTSMVSGFLAKEERKVLDESGKKTMKSFSDILGLLRSKNKEVRDTAAKAFNEILEKHSDAAEAEMNAILNDKKINDELRGFDRPDKARHLADDIETEVVDALVKAVVEKYDTSKKYYELKAKLLNVPKLKYHERNIEYGKIKKEYSYEDSVSLIHKVFSQLDQQFAGLFKGFVENNQIDVYPRKGKRDGAFCVHMLISQPTYIMLNHVNKLCDVTILAHELGHAINNELIKEKQNALNFDTLVSTAEVASTFMEDFVLQEIMKKADDELKLAISMQRLNDNISSIQRQIASYVFQQELHEEFRKKGLLPKEEIGGLFQKHMAAYMGSYVEQSPGSENWWVYWEHIRRYFYNYSYASGCLIAKALQRKVKENPKFIDKVKEFLSTGTSKSPKEVFADMGIDITKKEFWEDGLKEIDDLLKETEELAKKLKKI